MRSALDRIIERQVEWAATSGIYLDEKGYAATVEENLFQMRTTGRGQDSFRWPSKLVERLTYLSGGIGRMDFAPTMQHREVHGILEERIRTVRALLEALINDDLAAFNDLLRARNIRNIIALAR